MGLLNSELFDAVTQRPKTHAEEFCGRGLVVARLLERLHDRIALDAFQLASQGGRTLVHGFIGRRVREHLSRPRGRAQTYVIRGDHRASAQSESTLQDVLELADVAGKWIGLQ